MKLFQRSLLLIPLIFGGLIYIIFRSEKLLMFRWFKFLNLNHLIQHIRIVNNQYRFPNWFVYNLPDGLWIMSYILISIEIWNRKITPQNIFWIFTLPLLAIISEIFQFLRIIRGTFDFSDLIFYILGIIIPCLLIKNLKITKK